MATIFKRKGSRFYYARFQVNGKDYCVSTRETTRAKAVAAMQRKLAEAKGQRTIDNGLYGSDRITNWSVGYSIVPRL